MKAAPLKTFIIYARADAEYKRELLLHLKPLIVSKLLTVWHDGNILPGEDWERAIKTELKASELVIVLVSIESLNSDFIQTEELRTALEQLDAGQTRVVPVVVSPCAWKFDPVLSKLQALPTYTNKGIFPVSLWSNRDHAWTTIVEEVGEMVQEVLDKRAEIQRQHAVADPKQKELELAEPKNQEEQVDPILKLIEMVPVKGGTFRMGDKFEVTLSDYVIGKYPVTQKLWQVVMGNNPSHFKGDDLPVENISWNNCQQFIQKLNEKVGKVFSEGRAYRLPSEAEWEFAARGGTLSKGYEYAGSNSLEEVGWCMENSGSKTQPVGQKKANELGLFDMSGNVWEWCQGWYGEYPQKPVRDWPGPNTGALRVGRGGSWGSTALNCRPMYRNSWLPDDGRFSFLGFRLVLSLQSVG